MSSVARDAVQEWMRGYRSAWESNDPDAVGSLFTDDAEYFAEPFTQPMRGRQAIVDGWLRRADEPGDTSFEWTLLVEKDELAIVQGTTVYAGGPTYSNLWVIRFDGDGRATEFTEWWMDHAQPSE